MAQTDVLRSTDAQAESTTFVDRFNEWKRVAAVSEHARYTDTTSTFGGSTQTLPLAASTLGTQSEFLRNKYLEFSSGSASAWTLQTVLEDRTFIIRNRSDNVITLDTTDAGTITLDVPDTKTYTVNLFASVPAFILVKDHLASSDFGSTKPYSVAVYREGNLTEPSEVFTKIVLARTWDLPTNFIDSQGHLATPPDAVSGSFVVDILFNSTIIGTCTFTSGSTVGTFASASPFTFGAGDLIELRNPSTGSSAATNLSLTIYGSIL